MIVFIKMVGAGMEAYNWGSEVSATRWVLFIDYEQGNGEAGADEKHDEQKNFCYGWTAIIGLVQILNTILCPRMS